jgi:hypothetical protein
MRGLLIRGIFILLLLLTACVKEPLVEDLGIFAPDRLRSVLGQDGCTPVPLKNGITLWTFGDTLLGKWKKPVTAADTFEGSAETSGMISNSLAISPFMTEDNIRSLRFTFYKKGASVAPFIALKPGEENSLRLWPLDGIEINNNVYVYYAAVRIVKRKTGDAGLPFEMVGAGIGFCARPDWRANMPGAFVRKNILFGRNEPVFGDSAFAHSDYIYLSGRGMGRDGRMNLYLARVRHGNIEIREKYEFLDENASWSYDIKRSKPICSGVMGEASLSYAEQKKRYYVIYCGLDSRIYGITFINFHEIPKSKPVILYVPPVLKETGRKPKPFYYSAKEIWHGRDCVYAVYMNPAIYQPVLLKINYKAFESN